MSGEPPPDDATASQSLPDRPTLPRSVSAHQPRLQPEQRFGPYIVHRLIGRGGMGEVYEAEDLETGRRLALKLLLDPQPTPAARERFLREGRLAASISHPNSVYVYGTEEIKGSWVISMELASAGTLKDRVKAGRWLPIGDAVDAMLQVIDGLEAAADVGILHRDVKPSNCFVEADGTVKIGDFGLSLSTLASERSHLTSTGTFLGTPAFASPEQLRGDDLDVRSDIYSVGATLYYLLTGRPPFEDDNLMRLLTTIGAKTPASPRALRPEIPRGLADVVMRCLEKQPQRRYEDYAALRAALLPFGSWRPPLGDFMLRRSAAVLVDIACCWLPLLGFYVSQGGRLEFRTALIAWPMIMGVGFVALTLPTWFFGGSPGELLLRLRLVNDEGARPGLGRAALRASLVVGLILVYSTTPELLLSVVPGFVAIGRYRREGWRGPLESISGTFLISVARRRTPPAKTGEAAHGGALAAAVAPRIGAYSVVKELKRAGSPPLIVGRDDILARDVWIERLDPGAPPLPIARRDDNRPTRVRWLNGRRGQENWDAYEAPSGEPFLEATRRPVPWAVVRRWLLDVTQEVLFRRREREAQTLALTHVWVTTSGRALLLDAAAPGDFETLSDEAGVALGDDRALQGFLHRFAIRALVGGPVPDASLPLPAIPLPRDARCFLTELHARSFQHAGLIRGMLQVLVHQPLEVSRQERLFALTIFPLIFATLFWSLLSIVPRHPERFVFVVSIMVCVLGLLFAIARRSASKQDLERFKERLRGPVLLPRPVHASFGIEELLMADGSLPTGRAIVLRRLWALSPLALLALSVLPPLRPWSAWLQATAAGVYLVGMLGSLTDGGTTLVERLTGTRLVPAVAKSFRTGSQLMVGYESQRAALTSGQLEGWTGESAEDWENLEKVLHKESVPKREAPG